MDIKIFYSKTGFVQSDVFALVRNKRIFMRRNKSSRSQEETFKVSFASIPNIDN